ncbi:hypothetical protein HDU76_000513 [Blyttiomyces sp. JEL0837]|nr:hypothetical protein HDU76_000513 [Blyttiomyces sp. JEL0837]
MEQAQGSEEPFDEYPASKVESSMSQNDHASPHSVSSLKLRTRAMENSAKASAAETSQYRTSVLHGDASPGRMLSDSVSTHGPGLAAFTSGNSGKSTGSGFHNDERGFAQVGKSSQSGRSSRRVSMAEIKDRLNSQLSYNAGVLLEEKAKDEQLPAEDAQDILSQSTKEDDDFFTHRTCSDITHIYTVPDRLSSAVIDFDDLDLKGTYTNLLAMCAAAAYVAFGFVNGHHRFIWPIRTLRLIATVLPTVFYIPIFEVLAAALTCNLVVDDYHTTSESTGDVMLTLGNTGCLDPNRWPLVAVASVALLLYIPVCIAVAGVFFDTNPTLKHASNRVHGRVDIIYIVLKTLLTCAYHFLGVDYYWPKLMTATFVSICMWGAMLYYFPYYNKSINQIRGGFYGASTCIGFSSIVGAMIHDIRGEKVGYEIFGSYAFLFIFGYVGGYFIADQLNNQSKESDFLGLGVKLDVANYAEFQKNDREAKLNHFLALQEMKMMWKLLLDKEYRHQDLSDISVRLYSHAQKAQENYIKLLTKYPRSRVIMRYFARFCYDVTCDVARGDALTEKADELELETIPFPTATQTRTSVFASQVGQSELENDANSQGNHSPELKGVLTVRSKLSGSEAGSSGESGTSSSGKRSQNAAKRLRISLLEKKAFQLKMLLSTSNLIVLVMIISNFTIITTLLSSTFNELDNLINLQARERYTSLEFRRVRQIQRAYAKEDYDFVIETQQKLQEEMQNFTEVAKTLYKSRNVHDTFSEDYYTKPEVLAYISHLPLILDPVPTNVSLFTYMMEFTSNGFVIANASLEYLTNSSQKNPVRYILDNFYPAQATYDYSMDEIFFKDFSNEQFSAKDQVFILTAVQIFVIIFFLAVTDYTIRRFRDNQRHFLEVFRQIPKEIIREVLEDLEEIDNTEIFPQSILRISESMSARTAHGWLKNNFRAQQAFYSLVLMVLAFIFAYLNVTGIYFVGESFAILDQAGDMQKFSIRCLELLKEMVDFDEQTWNTTDYLNANYIDTADEMSDVFNAVIFGDPTRYPASPSYNE